MNVEDKIQELIRSGKTVYSFSRLSKIHDCRHEYKLSYIDKIKGRDNIWSKLGTLVHDGLEAIHNGEIDKNEFVNRIVFGISDIKNEGYSFPSETIESNVQLSLIHFIEKFKKSDENTENEKHFLININGNWIQGFIDKIVFNEDGTIDICDYKISSKFKKSDLKEKGMQLVLYAYAMEQMGYKINRIYWNMLKYVNVKWSNHCGRAKTPLVSRIDIWDTGNKKRLKKALDLTGKYTENEIEEIAMEMFLNNSIDIPEEIKEYVTIEDGIVEYEYNEETKDDLLSFIEESIELIENEEEFEAKSINTKNFFYCNVLCGQNNLCSAYREYVNSLNDVVELFGENVDLGDLFR